MGLPWGLESQCLITPYGGTLFKLTVPTLQLSCSGSPRGCYQIDYGCLLEQPIRYANFRSVLHVGLGPHAMLALLIEQQHSYISAMSCVRMLQPALLLVKP